MTQEFQQEKKRIAEEYQSKIQKLVKGHQENIQRYTQTIDDISKKIEEQAEEYHNLLSEKGKVSESSNVNDLKMIKQLEKEKKVQTVAFEDLVARFGEQEILVKRLQESE